MAISVDKKIVDANNDNRNDDRRYPLRLSIIVPIYRVERYVERCLRSLEDQDLPKDQYEIIAVDDGTPDRSAEIAERLAKEYGNIRVIHKENGGLSSARNAGMPLARGRYIMFVDSDDFVNSNSIRSVLEKAEAQEAELCYFRGKMFPQTESTIGVQPFLLDHIYDGEYAMLHGMHIASAWQCLYLHATLDRLGMQFPEGLNHEDIVFYYQLCPLAKRIIFVDDMVYNYSQEGESITRSSDKAKQEKNQLDCIIGKRAILDFLSDKPISAEMRQHISAAINSELVSIFIMSIVHRKHFNRGFAGRVVKTMRQQRLLPIKGKTQSRKTTQLVHIVNFLSLTFYSKGNDTAY